MIKAYKFNFGDYFQKIFLDENTIEDTECTCTWSRINKRAWKKGERICKHTKDAIIHLNIGLKKYGNRLKEKDQKGVYINL